MLSSPAGNSASGLGLVYANQVLIQYNFARVTDSVKRQGLGKIRGCLIVRLRGLYLKRRAWGFKPWPNTMELCPK